MALLNDTLTVWEIGHRWAGKDPSWTSLLIPLAARDNFRNMFDAILCLHLTCSTISLEKRTDDDDPHFSYIRDDLQAVHDIIEGVRFNRKLLKWARVERWAFKEWCEGHAIPLPDFWFPSGWGLEYTWPAPRAHALSPTLDAQAVRADTASPDGASEATSSDERVAGQTETLASKANQNNLRSDQRRRVACQEIAANLWKANPALTIAAMVQHDAVQNLGGAKYQVDEVVRRWVAEVAPADVKARRGRPRKNPTEDAPPE